MQVSRAATLDTASNATAITVSRLVDKREQSCGNPLYRPSFPRCSPGKDLVLLSRKHSSDYRDASLEFESVKLSTRRSRFAGWANTTSDNGTYRTGEDAHFDGMPTNRHTGVIADRKGVCRS